MPSIYGDYSKNVRLRIDYTIRQNDEDIANNRSVLSLNLYAEKTAHYGRNETGQSYYNMSGKSNTTVYWNWSSGSSEYYLGNSEVIVPHNPDGTGSTTLYGYWYLARSSDYMPTEISITQTISLPRIPRKSEITLSGIEVTLGNNITINTNRASNSFTHALYYQIDGGSWNVFATGVGASYTWTVPLTIANSLPNTTGKTINIICETYNGTSYIGSSVAPLYVYIPDSVVPSITAFNLSGGSSNGTYVEDLTNVNATVSATGAYSSSISTYKVELLKGSAILKTAYGTSISFPLTNINLNSQDTNLTLKATVTDSRGRVNTSSKTINVKYYYKPFFSSYNAYRSDASGNRSDSGTYIDLFWNYSARSISGVLTFTKRLRYRQVGTESWTNVDLANNSSVITGGGNISTNYQYEVQFYISDGFNSVQKTLYVQTGYSTVDYRSGGKGIAFGKASEKDEFECNMVADFKKNISWNSQAYSNVDANDFKKAGIYYMSENCSNMPKNYCRMIVMGREDSGDLAQIATFVSTGETWIRGCSNGTWHRWNRVSQVITREINANFNTLTESGIYLNDSVPRGENSPIAKSGFLEVFNMGALILQKYTTYDGSHTYQRRFYGTWNAWERIDVKASATAFVNSRLTISTGSWTPTYITLGGGTMSYSDKINKGTETIYIGSGVSRVKVSGAISWMNKATAGEFDLHIKRKRGSEEILIIGATYNNTGSSLQHLAIPPRVIDVQEGDVIRLAVITGTAETTTIIENVTFLTVEEVE